MFPRRKCILEKKERSDKLSPLLNIPWSVVFVVLTATYRCGPYTWYDPPPPALVIWFDFFEFPPFIQFMCWDVPSEYSWSRISLTASTQAAPHIIHPTAVICYLLRTTYGTTCSPFRLFFFQFSRTRISPLPFPFPFPYIIFFLSHKQTQILRFYPNNPAV